MLFRIYRMKEPAREGFRSAAHTSGLAIVRPKDYEPAGNVDAASAYDAWSQLRDGNPQLQTGDILEDESGSLLIAKYIGFERAQWWIPEPKPAPPSSETTEAGDVAGLSSEPAR